MSVRQGDGRVSLTGVKHWWSGRTTWVFGRSGALDAMSKLLQSEAGGLYCINLGRGAG